MKTIVIANQKGGIGKTTTATTLASILTEKGYKVLLIDMDQQGNSTDTFRGIIENHETLYDVLLEEPEDRIPISEAIQHFEGCDLVASDPLLRKADAILNGTSDGFYRLREALSSLKGYDFVVIDTAPALSSLLHNALVAADELIIPITTDRYALAGLAQLQNTITSIRKFQNPSLHIAGLLLVKYNERTNLAKTFKRNLEVVAETMNTKVFENRIRESVRARESQVYRCPLIEHDKDSTTAQDYFAFTDELLSTF